MFCGPGLRRGKSPPGGLLRTMDMQDTDLIIFDCDGVLIDSEIVAITLETELLRAEGCSFSALELSERFSGMHWGDMLAALERETGRELFAPLHDKVEALLDERLGREPRPIPGVAETLAQLPQPKCVCSNTKMPRLRRMLELADLTRFFAPDIFSAKDLGEGRAKPKPDIFLFGAAQMGVDPSRALVVEDSIHGVQAACRAGMRVIGFIGGQHSFPAHAQNLLDAGACRIVGQMRDLPAAIADLSR